MLELKFLQALQCLKFCLPFDQFAVEGDILGSAVCTVDVIVSRQIVVKLGYERLLDAGAFLVDGIVEGAGYILDAFSDIVSGRASAEPGVDAQQLIPKVRQ